MVYSFQTSEIKFTCSEDVPWTLDGEFGGNHKVVNVVDENSALEIAIE